MTAPTDSPSPAVERPAFRGLLVAAWLLGLAATAVAVVAAVRGSRSVATDREVQDSTASLVFKELGETLRNGLERLVTPAMQRTRLIATAADLLDPLRRRDRIRLARFANRSITTSTEVDIIMFFDTAGRILALNDIYHTGSSVPMVRLNRALKQLDDRASVFRQIYEDCKGGDRIDFQTDCRVTEALFGQDGLAVAYSVAVVDPLTGEPLGFVATRQRFSRLSALAEGSSFGGIDNSVYYIGDFGEYFSQDILTHKREGPVSSETLARMVAPLATGKTERLFTRLETRSGPRYIQLLGLPELGAKTGKGLQIMMLADEAWISREARQAGYAEIGLLLFVSLMLFSLGGVVLYLRGKTLANAELESAKRAAESSSASKSEFLANMSHEIRTPLTAILGYADLLLDKDMERAERDLHVETIRRNGQHLLTLVNDILDLSKIESGRFAVERRKCSLWQIVSDVVSLMRVRCEGKDVKLEVDVRGALPEQILTDPVRLRQILLNLVGNAIKFTDGGEVRIVVRTLGREGPKPTVSIEVRDTGIGMSHKHIERIFNPFAQAEAQTTERFGGTGLGLTISRRLTRMLGGDIAVTSEPGKGSSFVVTIDPGSLSGTTFIENVSEAMSARDAVSEETAAVCCGGRVLLAEDGRDNQILISLYLRKAGFAVEIAHNGLQAVEKALRAKAEGESFDVVLMDMNMPELDGVGATERLRGSEYTGPIIALTASSMDSDRKRCLEAGCDAFVTKPIEREAFLEAIRTYASA